jgi:hypothetical protein
MAVQSDTSSISYTGNNSTVTSYAVPFVFLENGHLQAIARTAAGVESVVTLTNHTGAGNVNGGTVRTAVAVPAASTLVIYREVPATQTTIYQEGGDFPAASHERALDKLTQIAQQNERKLGSALRLSEANQIGELNPPLTNQQHILSSVGGAPPSWQALPSLSIGPVIATGSTTARSVQDRFADVVNVKNFGAVGDGVTDDTSAIQAAINYAASLANNSTGGAVVRIPSGSYKITNDGTLNINNNFVSSIGDGPQSTFLNFGTGTNDCIKIDGTASNIRNHNIENLCVYAWNRTGGAAIKVRNTFNVQLSRIQIEGCYNGFHIAEKTNGTILNDCLITANGVAPNIGILWSAPPNNSDRSDVLTINNVVVGGQFSNATCFVWEGMCNTLDVNCLRLLHADKGMIVRHRAAEGANSSFYPSFLNAHNIQMEGFKTRALHIEAGASFKISGSDINNLSGDSQLGGALDEEAIRIEADTGANGSFVRNIMLANCRIGGCRKEAIVILARDVVLSGVQCYTSSFAGSGQYAAARIGATAVSVLFNGFSSDEFGGAGYTSHAVKIDNGAFGVTLNGIDAGRSVTGAIDNAAGVYCLLGKHIKPTLYVPRTGANAVFEGTSTNAEVMRADNSGADSYIVANQEQTSATNTFRPVLSLRKNNVTRFQLSADGSAVNEGVVYYEAVGSNPVHVFSCGGTETARINTVGIQIRSYTVATLPSAASAAQLIYVSDGASNKRLAVSDGTNWRFPDGNIVS